ncbi:MAG: tetraacyldisaccharide 4'-kinase, partial [Ginsengibacter sp.]
LTHQKVFFTKIEYSIPYHLFSKEEKLMEQDSSVLLVCGIANPQPLKDVLNNYVSSYEILSYRDHHIFNTDDLTEIKKCFSKMDAPNKMILTTQKDGVRLAKFQKELEHLPIYVFPMAHKFLFEQEQEFNKLVIDFLAQFSAIPEKEN